ncbi:oligopeptide/dipeptide ABC transporter ATP-binding protein [Rectinema subterraneum]|uniref:oligopeptide/dipeptide ABC transporter ATP-binding protein n=1 Tax=Rectinema subterraneum TaxID=2653714 RepID=UPI00131D9D27|nr:ABC transporter ATP-binding protein [Rectinema subterraneum]
MPRFDEAEEESSDLHLLDTFLDRVDQVVGHVRGAEGCSAARVGAFPVAFLVLFDALDPKFVVLDESPSALDVSIHAQILLLLDSFSKEKNLTYFFITHDLGVVKHFCDRILIMYLGNVCELAPTKKLFHKPLHPYTTSLLAAVLRPVVHKKSTQESILQGEVPSAVAPPPGCPFHTRCPKRMEICTQAKPELAEIEPEHFVACHLYSKAERAPSRENALARQ